MNWRQVHAALQAQGFSIRETKKGRLVIAPNGFTDTVHRDPTDASLRKSVSRLKNHGGFRWPPEKR